jgi:O-antigen/teichoic acid export membrane protein
MTAERIEGAPSSGAAERGSAHSSGGGHRRLAVNAVAGGVSNFLKIGVQVVMLPVMAHLLGPSEFGLYALALPTISFFMILVDGGLAVSLAREPREATLVWSTAFWMVLLVGVVLAVIVIGWGFALATLANESRVSGLMSLLSIALIMIALSALPSANLTRQGRLVVFAGADLVSTVAGAAFAVALAASGVGAKSLAAQYVLYYTLRAVMLNAVAFVRPTFQFQISVLRGHLSSGSALLSVKLSDFFGRLVENVLYGRGFGAAGLGVYSFSNQAPRFICEGASGPVWAALYAHAVREEQRQVEKAHVNLVRLLASLIFPVAALLSATAPEILGAILGPKWDQASVLLRILIPFYALHVVATQSGAVLLARNRGWLLFWITLALTVGRIGAVAAGPLLGQVGVAFGIGAVMTVVSYLMMEAPGYARRGIWSPLVYSIIGPAASSAVAGIACYMLARWGNGSLLWIVCCLALAGAIYCVALATIQPKTLRQDLVALRGLVFRRRNGGFAQGSPTGSGGFDAEADGSMKKG